MNKTQASRLLTLAHFLRTSVPNRSFDMMSVITMGPAVGEDNPEEFLLEGSCGSTACAIGWCPVVFPDQWAYVNDTYCWDVRLKCMPDEDYFIKAAKEFFGLSDDEANWLFDGAVQRTPKQEAKVIEDLVAEHGYEYAD